MGKFDNLWKVGKDETLTPEEKAYVESSITALESVQPSFKTQVGPALSELKVYLEKKYGYEVATILKDAAKIKTIKNKNQKEEAVRVLARSRKLYKEADAERKELKAPLLSFTKGMDGSFDGIRTNMEDVRNILEPKIKSYEALIELERRQAEKAMREEAERLQAELDKEAKKTGVEAVQVVVPVVAPKPTKTKTEEGTAYTVKTWKCRVINPDLVPRQYCEPSKTKLDWAVKGGVREIEGCEIYEDAGIRVRT